MKALRQRCPLCRQAVRAAAPPPSPRPVQADAFTPAHEETEVEVQ